LNMPVRCTKCGEELLGAVNRCWKCGQVFAVRPEIDGRPPLRLEMPSASADQPLEAEVLDDAAAAAAIAAESQVFSGSGSSDMDKLRPKKTPDALGVPFAPIPAIAPRMTTRHTASTAERIDAQRQAIMAMGGTVGSLVLGVFALVIATWRVEAAVIALLGLVMGIWGLYSPRRNWALLAMLLCCLAIGLGSYTGAHQLWLHIQKNKPVVSDE
jgi:hypothetical protein